MFRKLLRKIFALIPVVHLGFYSGTLFGLLFGFSLCWFGLAYGFGPLPDSVFPYFLYYVRLMGFFYGGAFVHGFLIKKN